MVAWVSRVHVHHGDVGCEMVGIQLQAFCLPRRGKSRVPSVARAPGSQGRRFAKHQCAAGSIHGGVGLSVGTRRPWFPNGPPWTGDRHRPTTLLRVSSCQVARSMRSSIEKFGLGCIFHIRPRCPIAHAGFRQLECAGESEHRARGRRGTRRVLRMRAIMSSVPAALHVLEGFEEPRRSMSPAPAVTNTSARDMPSRNRRWNLKCESCLCGCRDVIKQPLCINPWNGCLSGGVNRQQKEAVSQPQNPRKFLPKITCS